MRTSRTLPRAAGFTLVEAMVSTLILAVVASGLTVALGGVARTDSARRLQVQAQSEGRDAVVLLEQDLREASLGSSSGVIWTVDGAGNSAQRPSVQLYDNVAGGGALKDAGVDPKPGTDAVLVVGVETEPVTAAGGQTWFDSNLPFLVTDGAGLNVGDAILAGPYRVAGWGRIEKLEAVAAGTEVTLAPTAQSTFPEGRLDRGAMVRRAWARLYYVDVRDQLVRVVLARPRPPELDVDVVGREVVALGIENLQASCLVSDGTALVECGSSADVALTDEAEAALGVVAGARLDRQSIPDLRLVRLALVARSRTPLRGTTAGEGDVAIGNQAALPPGGGEPGEVYVRRTYQADVAVRNTSLEAL